MRKALLFACVTVTAFQVGVAGQKAAQNDWPSYGRDPGGTRHSPLTQITPQNVTRLERAWVYHTGEVNPNFEVTPVMVDNVLYLSTPSQKVVAVDATTGTEIWKFEPDPKVARPREHRGVAYWPGEGSLGPRILLATADARLIAIDAKTGKAVPTSSRRRTCRPRLRCPSTRISRSWATRPCRRA
jgi:quinoprotein glucose dehydrogenase